MELFTLRMDVENSEVAQDFSPFILVYKDGRIERLMGNEIVPPSLDDANVSVYSKDVFYSREQDLSCRLYLPKSISPEQKLPLLVYFHGGGFCFETAFSPTYHNHLNRLVEEANVIVVSVEYRRAPEHPIPIPFDDSWTALKWVASHAITGDGPEEWLNCHADFSKVFFAGDSAGATITHQMAMRHGKEKLHGVDVAGIVLVHPYFLGEELIGNEVTTPEKTATFHGFWKLACPATSGCDDPLINPVADPNFLNLGCDRVLVLVAEKDFLRDRGWHYYENLKKNGWPGNIEIVEAKDEDHVFHLLNPTCESAAALIRDMASFFHQDKA